MAAEFYVLSMLHKRGATAYLTLGNNKAVMGKMDDQETRRRSVSFGQQIWAGSRITISARGESSRSYGG